MNSNNNTSINPLAVGDPIIYRGKISQCEVKKSKLNYRRATEAFLFQNDENKKLVLQISSQEYDAKKGNSKPTIVDLTNVTFVSTHDAELKGFTFFCHCITDEGEMESYTFHTETEKDLQRWTGAIDYYMEKRVNKKSEDKFKVQIDKEIQIDNETILFGAYYLKVTPGLFEFYMTEKLSTGVKFNFEDVLDVRFIMDSEWSRGDHSFCLRFKVNVSIRCLEMKSKGGELLNKYLQKGVLENNYITSKNKLQTLPCMPFLSNKLNCVNKHANTLSRPYSPLPRPPLPIERTSSHEPPLEFPARKNELTAPNIHNGDHVCITHANNELTVPGLPPRNSPKIELPPLPPRNKPLKSLEGSAIPMNMTVRESEENAVNNFILYDKINRNANKYDISPPPFVQFPNEQTPPQLPPRCDHKIAQHMTDKNDLQNETTFEDYRNYRSDSFQKNALGPNLSSRECYDENNGREEFTKRGNLNKMKSLSQDDCRFIDSRYCRKQSSDKSLSKAYQYSDVPLPNDP